MNKAPLKISTKAATSDVALPTDDEAVTTETTEIEAAAPLPQHPTKGGAYTLNEDGTLTKES